MTAGASVDVAVLEELRLLSAGGDGDLLVQVIDLFLEDAPPHIESLRRAFADGDAERAAREAHALKGSSANLGARRLAELCEAVILRARGERLDGMEAAVAAIEVELEGVRRELLAARAQAKAELRAS